MEILAVVTMLALIECIVFGMLVGRARGLYGIQAPATSGHEMFDRYYRIHYNTIEQLVIFVPALWAFGYFVGPYWAAALGSVFLVGRVIFALAYIKEPSGRGPGVLLSIIPTYLMVLGGLIGAIISYW